MELEKKISEQEKITFAWLDTNGRRMSGLLTVPKAVMELPKVGEILVPTHAQHIKYEVVKVLEIVYQYSAVRAKFLLRAVATSANLKAIAEYDSTLGRSRMEQEKTISLQTLRATFTRTQYPEIV